MFAEFVKSISVKNKSNRRKRMFKRAVMALVLTILISGCGVLTTGNAMIATASSNYSSISAELNAYCSNLKTMHKPDRNVEKRLDTILSNAVSYLESNTNLSSGEYENYKARVKSQMDAVISGMPDASSTSQYLFLADNFEIPTVTYGETVNIVLPFINYGAAQIKDIIITPKVDISVKNWPFELNSTGYTKKIEAMPAYNANVDILSLRQDIVYTFTAREEILTGYYPIVFEVIYSLNNVTVSDEITTYVKTIGKPENGTTEGDEEEEEEEEELVSKPRIIVTGFETVPADVYAGDTFTVNIHVKNTSKTTAVSNVLFNMQAATEGKDETNTYAAFLPTSGSSSVYMDKIAPDSTKDISIEMTAKADLAQKPYVLNVDMTYDSDKVADLKDVASVSIPIKQEARFDTSTAEVMPAEINVGGQSNVMFSIYNTGKTTLYNVQVKYQGDYVEGGESFIGNLASGNTGSVDSMITAIAPCEDGIVKAIISYEDDAGNVTEVEKEFSLYIYEEVFEEPYPGEFDDMAGMEGMDGMEGMEGESSFSRNQLIGMIGGGAAGVVVLLIILVKIVKKRKAKKLLEEDLSFIEEADSQK